MASAEQMQAQINELVQQQSNLMEAFRRADQGYESQTQRLRQTEDRLQAQETVIQQMAAQTTAVHTPQTTRVNTLIDPRHVPKPPIYSGKKEEWEKFRHILWLGFQQFVQVFRICLTGLVGFVTGALHVSCSVLP